jgi:hypothetical protein
MFSVALIAKRFIAKPAFWAVCLCLTLLDQVRKEVATLLKIYPEQIERLECWRQRSDVGQNAQYQKIRFGFVARKAISLTRVAHFHFF